MKNLLIRTAWAWGALLCMMFSCSDSLEERIIEENNFQEQLEQQRVDEEGLLKMKGKDMSKGDDADEEDADDSENERGNNGKSEENKGKGKDKDSGDDMDDETDEDDADEDDAEEDDSEEEDTEEDEEDADDSENERGNNGKSEENKGKGKDKDSGDDMDDETDEDDASEEELQADFRTQTIGGWGSEPKGNTPGSYLHQNFEAAFPNGITIGFGEINVQFTSAQAVTDYLPSGGNAIIITESFVDPTAIELKNNFVSQLLAATITTGLDLSIIDFSKSELAFSRLEIAEGELTGLIVSQILEEANKVLVGEESDFTMSQLLEALTSINESFVDGKTSSGYLKN